MIRNITPSVLYIGVDDTDLDLFESQYALPQGVSYNSYLIIGKEKTAIVDSVDARKAAEWMDNLDKALAGRQPDYLIVQHMEPDHSGGLEAALRKYPSLTVVATAAAVKMMPLYVDTELTAGRTLAVGDGDTLPLGDRTLTFVTAPMVHWPEVMVTADSADGILFSADAFGKFGALSLTAGEEWACEARRYYFNIVGKYGANVQTLLRKVAGARIDIIAPLHGPVLSDNIAYYTSLYDIWSRYQAETPGVLVAHASIYGNTAAAARRVADMLRERGVGKVSVMDLTRCDQAEAVEDAFRLDRMVLASSTYDANIFPPMHDFLHHLRLKGFRNRKVALIENGSWSPIAARKMRDMLAEMRDIEIVEPAVTLRGRMTPADEVALEALASAMV